MHVMITGANRGLGAELATQCVVRGDTVIGTTRGNAPVPEGVRPLTLDVTQPDSHAALAHKLDGQAIDLLVCNAGVYLDKAEQLSDGYPAQMWADTFAANVTGVFLIIQHLLPNLQVAKAGKIAILSSSMASDTRAPGGSYIYRASKAAVLNLGRNLAKDLEALELAVGIYHPGWVRTEMGGAEADLSADVAVAGLLERFDALTVDKTGCFQTWDGHNHPY